MGTQMTDPTGCGGHCGCGESAAAGAVPRINGIALHAAGERHGEAALRELAWAELLRQQAVRLGYLPALQAEVAPALDEAGREALEAMLDAEVPVRQPDGEESRRHYDANRAQFAVGQSLQVRHILFAVTPGVDVQKLVRRAEESLHELSLPGVPGGRFAELAATLSNCPSGASGGELGWLSPHELSPELAKALFFRPEGGMAKGLQPLLIHSRFGLHIVEVTGQQAGRQPAFEEVREQIAARLALQSRATALHQYITLLAGQAEVSGIELDGALSPLVQ